MSNFKQEVEQFINKYTPQQKEIAINELLLIITSVVNKIKSEQQSILEEGYESAYQIVDQKNKLIRWSETALQDISERVEHAGTTQQMIDDIKHINKTYWSCKNNLLKEINQ